MNNPTRSQRFAHWLAAKPHGLRENHSEPGFGVIDPPRVDQENEAEVIFVSNHDRPQP